MEKVKTNILIIGERFFPEEFLINDVVKYLQENDCSCTIITHQPSYPTGKIFSGFKNDLFSISNFFGAKVHRISFLKGYNNYLFLKMLNYFWFVVWGVFLVLFRVKKVDKILIYQTGPLTQAFIGIAAKWKFKKPLYIWTWDIWPDSVFGYGFKKNILTNVFLENVVKFIYRRCDFIWISSPGFRQIINKYTDTECIDVPNWVIQPDKGNADLIDFSEGFHFTFTGNLGKVQNLENVILGFGQAFQNEQKVYLNLVGDGSNMNTLKTLVNNGKIKNVVFWGKRPYNEMNAFYKQSNVLIISLNAGSVWNLYLPSKFQNYLIEKIPILGIIDGTVKDLIGEYKLGVQAKPDDLDLIKNAYLEIFKNYNYYREVVSLNSDILSEQYKGTQIKNKIYNYLVIN